MEHYALHSSYLYEWFYNYMVSVIYKDTFDLMHSLHMPISTSVRNVRSIRPIQCSYLAKYLMMKDFRCVAESSLACEAEELFTLAEKWALRFLCWHVPALLSFFNQPEFENNCCWWCGQHEDWLFWD